jgi:hypothetical protein
LARTVGDARGYDYKSFDDDVLRAGALADPVSFVADLTGPVVLDEGADRQEDRAGRPDPERQCKAPGVSSPLT